MQARYPSQPLIQDPRPLEALLQAQSRTPHDLQTLCATVKKIRLADQVVRQNLPTHLQSCCTVADLSPISSPTIITLRTTRAIDATQMRYQQHAIINALKKHAEFTQITKLHIKISMPEQAVAHTQNRSIPCMSPDTSTLLLSTAAHVKNPVLQAALLRLAENGKSATGLQRQ